VFNVTRSSRWPTGPFLAFLVLFVLSLAAIGVVEARHLPFYLVTLSFAAFTWPHVQNGLMDRPIHGMPYQPWSPMGLADQEFHDTHIGLRPVAAFARSLYTDDPQDLEAQAPGLRTEPPSNDGHERALMQQTSRTLWPRDVAQRTRVSMEQRPARTVTHSALTSRTEDNGSTISASDDTRPTSVSEGHAQQLVPVTQTMINQSMVLRGLGALFALPPPRRTDSTASLSTSMSEISLEGLSAGRPVSSRSQGLFPTHQVQLPAARLPRPVQEPPQGGGG
jgi:hypothetical protein